MSTADGGARLEGHAMNADARFDLEAESLGYNFDGDIKIGGNYVPLVRDGRHVYLSGQIPRVENTVVVTGPGRRSVSSNCRKMPRLKLT